MPQSDIASPHGAMSAALMGLQFKCVCGDITKTKGYLLPQHSWGYAAEEQNDAYGCQIIRTAR